MSKLSVLASIATALMLSASVATAATAEKMEDCKVMKDGINLVKAGESLSVPAGMCGQINDQLSAAGFNGTFKGVPAEIIAQLDLSSLASKK